jgi:plasmid stability protein
VDEIVIDLDDAVEEALKQRASANNRSVEAEIRLILARAVGFVPLDEKGISVREMRFSDFVGIAASGRGAEEITADIRALRNEWDD